ncbi:MAG: hypothetical protein K1X89_06830 [Myxococcaceae bacterium]|nr:hypothetical protein [Myxococcaceae bacterium]
MRPDAFVDARDVPPLHVGRATLEVLVESGLVVAPRSALSVVLATEETPTAAQRDVARAELQRRGLAQGPSARPSAEGALLLKALEIVAQPDAELQLESKRRGDQEPSTESVHYLMGDGVAAVSWVDERLQVHAAVRAETFATQLSKRFQPSEAPAGFEALALSRSQVEATTLVFGDDADVARPLPRAEALAHLQAAGVDDAMAAGLVEVLAETGVVSVAGETLVLNPGVREAMRAVWSGESLELVVRDLTDDAPDDEPEGVAVASFYVSGPPGQRLIVDVSEALDEQSEPNDQAASDPDEALDSEVLQFTWLTRAELHASLEALLGLGTD